MQRAATVDMERYKHLTARLADELARGTSLTSIANIAGISARDGSAFRTLPADRIRAWTLNPEAMRDSWHIGQIATADEIEQKLTAYFADLDARHATQTAPAVASFVETAVSRKVWGGFEQAREECELVEISAPPGTGKTCAADQYLAQCRKLEGFGCPVWRITLSEFSLSIKSVMALITDEINAGSISTNYATIEDQTEGRGGLLIVDEAQHIGDARLNQGINILNGLRYFVDRKLFGIAFLSNGEIYRRVSGAKHTQLSSRMEAWRVVVRGVPDEDVDLIMAEWGISGKPAREWCIKKTKGAGGLRALTHAFRHAAREFGEVNHQTLTMLGRV